MPYGHNKQYRELVLEAQRKRLKITRQQQQQIARLYRDIAKDMGKEIAKKSEKTLTYRWLKDYAKALKNQSKILYSDIQGIVSLGILNTAEAFVDAEQAFWSGLVPGLSERFQDTFSSIPQTCVDELMNGGIYKDFTGLSERIWSYQKKYDRDIGYMIERGIVAQKSAYELAKDLEMYVNPKAKKPWEWQKVYPNCNRVVDYNAQRLARTSVTHAYQLSFQRATKDNPFVEQYQWNSSNAGKTCELCAKRDGKLFDKDKLPLDHPNGMCVVTAVIPKELDEIAEELNDWADGGSNPALDKWLGTGENESDVGEKIVEIFSGISGQKRRFKENLENVEDKNVKRLLEQSLERVTIKRSKGRKSKYSADERVVYLAKNARSDTLAHELFHEIDVVYGLTENGMLSESVVSDYNKLRNIAKGYGKSIEEMLYSRYPKAFRKDTEKLTLKEEYRGISDILNGMSGGEINLGYWHDKEYWEKTGRVESESFAQSGRVLYKGNPKVLDMFKSLFPSSYNEIIERLERMIK